MVAAPLDRPAGRLYHRPTMPNQPDAEPPAGRDPSSFNTDAPGTGPAAPRRARSVRISRRTALRLTSVGALAGISLVSLYVGQRGPESGSGGPGRPIAGPFPTPTAGSARTAGPAETAPARAAGPTTVDFLSWWWTEPRRAEAWRALVEHFHTTQDGVRIQEVAVPAPEYARRLLGQIATGGLKADTFAYPDEIAVRLVRGKHLDALDGTIERLGIGDRLDQSVQAIVTQDGRPYGLLASLDPSALVYNRELLAAAEVAEPPTTPDGYLEVARKVTSRPERFGHAGRATLDDPAGWWEDLTQWVLAYGGTWATARRPLADSEPVLRAVEAYKALHDGAMPRGAGGDELRRLVGEGKVVQYVARMAELEAVPTTRESVAANLFTAPPPWEGQRSVARASYVGIAAGSKKKQAARAWWEFAFRPENVRALLERSGDVVPIYAGALREEAFADQPWASGFQAARPVVLSTTIEGFEASVAEFRRIVLERVDEVLTAGKAPEIAMREAQQGLEGLASRI